MYKQVAEFIAATMLVIGLAIIISAISAYNHGNVSYAIYAVGAATYCGTAAVTFAIVNASRR